MRSTLAQVSRPRVAIDVSPTMDAPMTGVGYYVRHLTEAFLVRNPGFSVHLFAARARRVPMHAFPIQSGFDQLRVVPGFRRLKARLWPAIEWPPIEWFCGDVELAHGMFHDLPASRDALRIATIHDVSFLAVPHCHTRETVRLHTRLVRHCAAKADLLLTVSAHCRSEVVRILGVNEERVLVVPGGVDMFEWSRPVEAAALDALKSRLGVPGRYFVHLGTIEPRKNLPRLLEAYALLRTRRSECPTLLLVGQRGWKAEPTFEAIQRLRLGDSVRHAGYLSRPETVLLVGGATACVYPSLYEGFGLPVLEAMAAGAPVVASRAGALVEVSGGHAVHVDAEDTEALAAALEEILDEPEEAAKRATAARKRAETMTWTHSATALERAYRHALTLARR